MSRHVYDSSRLQPTTHKYAQAIIKANLATLGPKLTARWLVYQLERSRQDSRTYKLVPTPRCWAHIRGNTVGVAEQTVKRLLLEPTNTRSLNEYAKLKTRQLVELVLPPISYARCVKFAERMEYLFRRRRHATLRDLLEHPLHFPRVKFFTEWFRIKRGSDLFIKGLGSFDINQVTRLPVGRRRYSVLDIRALGYARRYAYGISLANETGAMRLLLHPAVLPYTIRWWNQGALLRNHVAEIDELNHWFKYRHGNGEAPDLMGVPPASIFSRIEVLEQQRIANRITGRVSPPPDPQKPYPVKCKLLETPLGQLKPISNYGELVDVAEKMHNCAKNYHSTLSVGRETLVTLWAEGKPVALGQITEEHGRLQLAQCYGPCNKKAPPGVTKAFSKYIKEGFSNNKE